MREEVSRSSVHTVGQDIIIWFGLESWYGPSSPLLGPASAGGRTMTIAYLGGKHVRLAARVTAKECLSRAR